MDVTYRGAGFSGTINEAKVYGYLPAILLNMYAQIQYVNSVELNLDEYPDIFWFETHRSVIESNTGFSVEEQLRLEELLKYFSVLEVSDDGEDAIKVRINNQIAEGILRKPNYYIEEFKKAGII